MLQVLALLSRLTQSMITVIETWLFRWLQPSPVSPALNMIGDLTRSRVELVAENVLLRHQLGILQRQIKRPQLTKGDRLGLLFWASRLHRWKQAILIVKPETLLRWHREGFRLFWKWKSKCSNARPGLPQTTIDLIQRMANENPLGVPSGSAVSCSRSASKLPSAASRNTWVRCGRDPHRVRTGRPF